MSATIFLVHGTFVRNAAWTQAGSALRTALESIGTGNAVKCVPINWSGSNLQSQRLKAAEDLHTAIRVSFALEPSRRVVVVAHSHGGSIINIMLSRHPDIAERLSGLVFISTPFIQISRRAHTEGLRRLSEHLMGYFSPIIPIAIVIGLVYLAGGKSYWWMNTLGWFYVISTYLAFKKIVNARLPEVTFSGWAKNIFALYSGVMLSLLPAAGLNEYLRGIGWNGFLSGILSIILFIPSAFAILKLWGRFNLIYDTVGDETHIVASIQRIIEDFKQPEVPANKSLYVRFTSDEASLILALAQGFSKITEFCVSAIVAFFSIWSAGFRRAFREDIGVVGRLAWLAVIAAWLYVATNTTVAFMFGIFGLVEASLVSLADAMLNWKLPDRWNWSHSFSMELLKVVEPYTKWSLNFNGQPAAMLNVYIAAPVVFLTLVAAVLAFPFGAAYFWSALYVNFNVESAPTGECNLVTFPPLTNENLEEDNFWNASQLAHSLGYSDPRSIQAIRDRIDRWLSEPDFSHPAVG